MGRYYLWEAYWDGENPCELNCRALTFRFYALLNKTVIDGTLCRPNDPTRVCVAGTCKTIGCDGIVGSDKRPDACGVCGGSNSTCQIVSGIFTEPQLPPGYNLVAQLPKGACHVNITEFKPSRNYLALRRSDGTFVFNGNWAINWSGEYQAAGTTFAYRRQDTTTPELITTQGPLTEPIDIMVIYQQINPGIKYEYMLPLGVANSNIVPRPSNNPSPTVQTDGLNGGTASSSIIVPPGRFQLDAASNSPTATNFLGANPSPPRSLGSEGGLFQTIQSNQQGSAAGLGGIHQQLSPPSGSAGLGLSNYPTNSGNFPSSLSSSGSLATLGIAVPGSNFDSPSPLDHVNNNNPSVLSAGDSATIAPAVLPNKETGRTAHQNHGGRTPNKRRQHGHRIHNKPSGGAAGSSSAPGEQGKLGSPELQAIDPNVATPPPHRRGPRRHPNGKGFVWKQVGFSECSKTCGGGVQQALIVCVRDRDQVPVADHRCKEEDRPPSETVRCGPKPCPADWVLGEWTPCSVTCGDGIQTRDLTCKQEISATLTMRVNEAACLGAAPLVPRVRNCNLGHCAKWHTSDWGKCSTSCGKGMRHRRVYCQGFDGRDVGESDCSAMEKPSGSDICDMGSCSANTWFFTEWTGQCSEECGTGIQTRKAHCSSNSEMDCDVSKKPDTSRTCVSAKDCSGKWFAGPWSQCSATCDEGTQTREVICLTFMRGQYRVGLDMQCPARDKPNNTAPCNLGKCLPQWYTTDWSECSATCGTGAQRREVKCLDSNQMPSQDCREEDRPLLRQACNVRTNCNEVPGNDENGMEAQDTPVISVESNRNNNETETMVQEPVKPKKAAKLPKSSNKAVDSAALNIVTTAPTIGGDGPTTDASASASGEGCSDKFKNCHLVVQARLCKLKYYLVSCCASCSKPKT
ncbi:thrombospondin type-1 domain-containing protein 4-like isoform X2 [Daphnia pulicaria]|nr:thrombospondin type-1 domain-containing protein 4-like isoform X2 [Daphnia pulicaria]